MSFKPHFARFLGADPGRLHFAAHSHHPWPDVSFEAHQRAWLDAARWMDGKWEPILGELLPRLRGRVARVLALSDPGTLAFGPNTHEFLVRIASCVEGPLRILATDGEFHSFERQARRWQEAGRASVERLPCQPLETLAERLMTRARTSEASLFYFSQVLFDSGFAFEDLASVCAAAPPEALVVVDGYHGFCARPTSLAALEHRAFYLAGGYKYAMAGEGACFLHCPPGVAPRPVDTGWFAGFGELAGAREPGQVPYARDGWRFWGATFDPTALYRLDASLGLLEELGLDARAIHDHARALQRRFLERADELGVEGLARASLLPGPESAARGNFLAFRSPRAQELCARLATAGVVTDARGDRLRIGFGIYHDPEDVDELLERARALR